MRTERHVTYTVSMAEDEYISLTGLLQDFREELDNRTESGATQEYKQRIFDAISGLRGLCR